MFGDASSGRFRITCLFAAVGLSMAAALSMVGCGHYSFSPSIGGSIKTVAVPVFENETLEFGVEQELTDAVIEMFSDDGTLRVVGEESADSILRGVVSLYERPVLSYDSGGNPREYKVRIVATMTYEDLTKAAVVWDGEIEGWSVYAVSGEGGDVATEEEARALALESIAQDVLSKSVQGW